jgi:hypothetical protein
LYLLSLHNLYLSINTRPAGINLNLPDLNDRIPITTARMPAAPVQIKVTQNGYIELWLPGYINFDTLLASFELTAKTKTIEIDWKLTSNSSSISSVFASLFGLEFSLQLCIELNGLTGLAGENRLFITNGLTQGYHNISWICRSLHCTIASETTK